MLPKCTETQGLSSQALKGSCHEHLKIYESQSLQNPCAQTLKRQAKALLMFAPPPAGSGGAEAVDTYNASGSPRAAAGNPVWNASGSIGEGSASQVGLVSCVLAIASLFRWPPNHANVAAACVSILLHHDSTSTFHL